MRFLLDHWKLIPWEGWCFILGKIVHELCQCDEYIPEFTVAWHSRSLLVTSSPVQSGQPSSIVNAIWSGTCDIQDFYGKQSESCRVMWTVFRSWASKCHLLLSSVLHWLGLSYPPNIIAMDTVKHSLPVDSGRGNSAATTSVGAGWNVR